MHTKATIPLLCCLLLAVPACKSNTGGKGNTASPAGGQACALLSDSDIQAVQGEAVSERQGSERAAGALITSQCFYRLPTFNKSVSLEIIRPARGEAAGAVGEFWEKRFRRDVGEDEGEKEREKERAKSENGGENGRGRTGRREEEEKEEGARPEPVEGLGDEAFWAGNQINASLYVRKGDVIVRLSIGGPEGPTDKIQKTRTLATQVLKRLGGQS